MQLDKPREGWILYSTTCLAIWLPAVAANIRETIMKTTSLSIAVLFCLVLTISACGGGNSQADSPEVAADAQPATASQSTGGATGSVQVQENAANELLAGRPVAGIDPDSGLEINPLDPQQGVEYVVRGQLVSFNLIPQNKPEFVLRAPHGTTYRIQSQPVPDIFFQDGSQLAPHEYQRFMLAEATILLEDASEPTTVVKSQDLVLLALEE